MSQVYVAFYKHKRNIHSMKSALLRLFDVIIRLSTRGEYSHCEVVIANSEVDSFDCFTSSCQDGGVRKKAMKLPKERWDLVEVKLSKEDVQTFFEKTKLEKYDFIGAFGIIFRFKDDKHRYFCSEWCAECIGLKNAYKFSPNALYQYLQTNPDK